MSYINFGSYKRNKFFKSSSEELIKNKIENKKKFTDAEKVSIGKSLGKIENKSLPIILHKLSRKLKKNNDTYFIKRADIYLNLRKKITNELRRTIKSEVLKGNSEIKACINRIYKNVFPVDILDISIQRTKDELQVNRLFHLDYTHTVFDEHNNKKPKIHSFKKQNNDICVLSSEQLTNFYQKMNNEKRDLILKYLGSTIHALSRITKYPFINETIGKIRENLDQWETFLLAKDLTKLKFLKDTIRTQLINLKEITKTINKFPNTDTNERLFLSMQLKDRENLNTKNKTYSLFIFPAAFINGGKRFTKTHSLKLTQLLQKKINHQKDKKLSLTELEKRRKNSPISSTAIKSQANLHKAIRESKAWVSKKTDLVPEGTSVNNVYKLGADPSNKNVPVSFFKSGSGDIRGAAIMETLIWDIAVIFGIEEQFVPTSETDIQLKRQIINSVNKTYHGSIQIAQKGRTLNDYLYNYKTRQLDRKQVIDGVLTSMVFGMFDAHSNNIFVTTDRKIKFFDNTCSLPNSNGFIARRNKWTSSSFRCALLDCIHAKKTLNPEEKIHLSKALWNYRLKFNSLIKFLNSKTTQARIKKLPPGWLNIKQSLLAMQQRIYILQRTLKENKFNTLQDIAAKMPNYKFAYAMTRLLILYEERFNSFIHNRIGYDSIETTLKLLIDNKIRIDINKLKKICDTPNITFLDLDRNIHKLLQEKSIPTDNYNRILAIYHETTNSSKADFKDLNKDSCLKAIKNINFKQIEVSCLVHMFSTQMTDENNIEYLKYIDVKFAFVTRDYDNFMVIYKTDKDYQIKDVFINEDLGIIKVDNKKWPINKYLQHINNIIHS